MPNQLSLSLSIEERQLLDGILDYAQKGLSTEAQYLDRVVKSAPNAVEMLLRSALFCGALRKRLTA